MGIDNPVQIQTENAFAEQRRVDPFGHALHAWLGALWCAAACGPTSLVEIAWLPLALCWLIRFPRHARLHTYMGRRAATRCLMGFAIWSAASLAWTLDRKLGLEEFGVLRFALVLPLLWPVMDRRGLLIAGLAAGMLAANAAQIAHAAAVAWDIEWLRFPRMPGRNSGWWQPVVAGTMLTAALGLHLPAALTGRGWGRIAGLAGSAASVLGVLATGSRGAWLASAVLVVAAAAWAVVRWTHDTAARETGARGRIAWGRVGLIGAAAVALAAGAWVTLGPSISSRARAGLDEVRRAVRDADYSTDTGARILMARLAIEAIRTHPVRGVGAGGYRRFAEAHAPGTPQGSSAPPAPGAPTAPAPARIHDHAHNALLHAGATTGLIGAALLTALAAFALIGGFEPGHTRPAPSPTSPSRSSSAYCSLLTAYFSAPAWAMLGLVLVSPFDVVQVNTQTAAVLFILVALCMRGRPREAAEHEHRAKGAGPPHQ